MNFNEEEDGLPDAQGPKWLFGRDGLTGFARWVCGAGRDARKPATKGDVRRLSETLRELQESMDSLNRSVRR